MRFKPLAKLILGFFVFSLIFFSLNSNGADAVWRSMANNSGHDNLSSSGWVQSDDMALDSNGNPFIVWLNDASAGDYTETYIHFSKWTPGVGWTKMSGTLGDEIISTGSPVGQGPYIKLGSNNMPYVIWSENDDNIIFSKWTIGADPAVCGPGVNDCWTNMAGTIAGSETISIGYYPQLALDSSNNPYITWYESGFFWNLFFTHWDGSQWSKMDGSAGSENVSNSSSSLSGYNFAILLDSGNNPNLVWSDMANPWPGHWRIFFSKWTPSACGGSGCWTKMDGTAGNEDIATSSDDNTNPDLKLDSANRPYVVWRHSTTTGESDIYLTKWTPGTGWTAMDGTLGHDNISADEFWSDSWSFLIDNSNNPEIIWPNGLDILYKKWTPGTGWTKADGTLGYDNITNSGIDFQSTLVKMRLSSSGQPNLSWVNSNNEMSAIDIYFSKWSGTAWVKMDGTPGSEKVSDTGTVISYNNDMQLNSEDEPFFSWLDSANGVSYDLFFASWTTASGSMPLTGEVTLTAEVEPSLTLTLTSTACDLGSFDSANLKTCSYGAEVSTNGSAGYTALINSDGDLRNATNSIVNVSGGSVTPATESYGLSTTKSSQTISQINDANSDTFYTQADCAALNNQGSTDMTASALTTSEQTFASSGGPVAADTTYLCHAVAITGTTPAGAYSQLVTITAIGNF